MIILELAGLAANAIYNKLRIELRTSTRQEVKGRAALTIEFFGLNVLADTTSIGRAHLRLVAL